MPLNMNTLGMGNSSGNKDGSSGSCIYSNNEYKETLISSDNPEFSFSKDLLVEPSHNYWSDNTVRLDEYNYQTYVSFQFFINHSLYVLIDTKSTSSGLINFNTDDGVITSSSSKDGLFKVNENGSLTKITLPFSGYNYINYRRTGIFNDHAIFAITDDSYRIYNIRNNGSPFNLYLFNGTNFTQIGNIINIYEKTSSNLSHYYYSNDDFCGFYFYKNKCYIQFNLTSYGQSKIVTSELDELYNVKVSNEYGPYFSLPDHGGNLGYQLLSHHHVAICGDYAYILYYDSQPDPNYSVDPTTIGRGVAKYKIGSNNFQADTLTEINRNFIYRSETSSPTSSGVFLSSVAPDHLVAGLLFSDGIVLQENGGYYQNICLLNPMYDIRVNNYNGDIIEENLCISNISGSIPNQYIGKIKLSTDYRERFSAWSEAVAFDLDVEQKIFRWTFCTQSSSIYYLKQTNYTKFTLLTESGKTSEYIHGYFQEGDKIFVDDSIDDVQGPVHTTPKSSKYTIPSSGIYTLLVSSSSENIPIVIIQDKYGSYQKIDLKIVNETTITLSVLKNMKINDTLITESASDYQIIDESFSKRINVSMEGV